MKVHVALYDVELLLADGTWERCVLARNEIAMDNWMVILYWSETSRDFGSVRIRTEKLIAEGITFEGSYFTV